jgi:large subunit ribosomal protein L23
MKNILQKPLFTEKYSSFQADGKYAFQVDIHANKPQIKQAILDRYPNVEVKKINTMIVPSKPKGQFTRAGYVKGRSKVWKKAIVTLKEGEIDLFSEI